MGSVRIQNEGWAIVVTPSGEVHKYSCENCKNIDVGSEWRRAHQSVLPVSGLDQPERRVSTKIAARSDDHVLGTTDKKCLSARCVPMILIGGEGNGHALATEERR